MRPGGFVDSLCVSRAASLEHDAFKADWSSQYWDQPLIGVTHLIASFDSRALYQWPC